MWETSFILLGFGIAVITGIIVRTMIRRRARKRLQRASTHLESIARESRSANENNSNNMSGGNNNMNNNNNNNNHLQRVMTIVVRPQPTQSELILPLQPDGEMTHAIPIQLRGEAVWVNGALLPSEAINEYGSGHYLPRLEDGQESKVFEEEMDMELVQQQGKGEKGGKEVEEKEENKEEEEYQKEEQNTKIMMLV
ncbi:hypothetical protein LSM04_001353 [Trypanosoma melophagium]|uniref:uncharacterized protein n=1 Tax=Trypanosoma melophagium TaxID=715481 RepID=UPI00351A4D87|nr:hypothetical protein LSM04_001353 [Trypanosoma melophagium]